MRRFGPVFVSRSVRCFGIPGPCNPFEPVAVDPDHRNIGLGTKLMNEAIEAARVGGTSLVVLVGDDPYYGRFGFKAETAAPLQAPFSGPPFQALEITPGALARGGRVRYAAAFGVS